jgi:hypothetical protein
MEPDFDKDVVLRLAGSLLGVLVVLGAWAFNPIAGLVMAFWVACIWTAS